MDGTCHETIGLRAFDALPEWEQKALQPDMSAEGLARPWLSDSIRTVRDKVAFLCRMLDLIYNEECRPYATLPDGRWVPHAPPDENFYASTSVGNRYSPEASAEIISLLMGRMVAPIRVGDWEEAVRHGGALAHYLQEPFAPGHAVSNDLFLELFPDPDPGRHIRVHHEFDRVGLDFSPLPAALMGNSIPEAAFRLQIELDRGIVESKKLVAPFMEAIYAGRAEEIRSDLFRDQGRKAAFLTASAWHTALSIGLERFDDAEAHALASIDVTQIVPYFWHHWQYVQLLPGCLVENGRKIPIHVWVQDGDEKRDQLIENGFGMGGHMGIKFFVNGDVYGRFRCRVGLPSRHTEGQTEHTNVRFMIETDKKLNQVYSEDIEYQAERRVEQQLEPGGPLKEIEVDITGARTLILSSQSQPYTDPQTGQVGFSIPHIAVCEPVLIRT